MNKRRSLIIIVLTLALCLVGFTMIGCTDDKEPDDVTVECTGITLRASGYDEGSTWVLERGKTVTIVGTVTPANATVKTLTWASDNPDIAIEADGDNRAKITTYDYGTATITVTCGSYVKTINVECVAQILPTAIVIEDGELEIALTDRVKLAYDFVPENATARKIYYTVTALNGAEEDMISVVEENGEYYVQVSSLAVVGTEYEITLVSSVAPSVRGKVKITVGSLEVEEMTLKTSELTLSVHDPVYRITPVFEPFETSYKEVTFTTDDVTVCDVDSIGTLIPKKAGVAVITVTNAHNAELSCSMNVTVTEEQSEYVTRLIKKSDVDALSAVSYSLMDFETDKVAFNAWKKVLSEDSNSASHISDAGWAIWMVGFDTYNDDNVNGGEANACVYCKISVPETASRMQYVFRTHPLPDDNAKFKILAIDANYNVTDCTGGWVEMTNNADMFINIDVESFRGQDVTFVVYQDQIGNKSAGNYMKVSLMFRRCLFDTDNSERWIEDEAYSILKKENNQ